MSLNDIQNRIDELFTDNSSIYDITMNDYGSCLFVVDGTKYSVKIIPLNEVAEIVFYYFDSNGLQKSSPSNLKENQFKIINTVVECVKLLIKSTEDQFIQYDFSGNIKQGLAKVYSLIGKKLKNSLEGYTFTEDKSLQNYYFSITKKDDLNELFQESSNIYPIEVMGRDWYEFTDGDLTYRVRKMNEIYFSYYDEEHETWMTKPTKNNKNQFKVLNTVIYCFKKIIEDNNRDSIKFSGQNNNGLAKLYKILFNKLKDFIIKSNYVGFYTDDDFETYFFLYKKEKFDYDYWDRRMDPESLVGYTPGENEMKTNLKESSTVSIVNADGSSITITSDDVNELSQIMKNAGLSIPDLSVSTDGDIEIAGDMDIVGYEDEYVEQPIDSLSYNEIPAYDLVSDEDEYSFDLGDTGYDIDYEDPYGDLSDTIGYVEEVAELNEEIIISITGNITNSLTKSIVNWCNNYDGNINLISVGKKYPSKTVFKIKCSDEITAEEFISAFEQINGGDFNIESQSAISEVAELNASVPYDEDAEESGFNIKGTAHQSDLRYVPGMAADNPMVDELREGLDNEFENELNDAISYCRDEIDESDMLDSLDLGRAGPIDIRYKHILISKLANYLYSRYTNDIANGTTALTPNNFEGMASYIFEDNLWHILQGEGFYWTSNND